VFECYSNADSEALKSVSTISIRYDTIIFTRDSRLLRAS